MEDAGLRNGRRFHGADWGWSRKGSIKTKCSIPLVVLLMACWLKLMVSSIFSRSDSAKQNATTHKAQSIIYILYGLWDCGAWSYSLWSARWRSWVMFIYYCSHLEFKRVFLDVASNGGLSVCALHWRGKWCGDGLKWKSATCSTIIATNSFQNPLAAA